MSLAALRPALLPHGGTGAPWSGGSGLLRGGRIRQRKVPWLCRNHHPVNLLLKKQVGMRSFIIPPVTQRLFLVNTLVLLQHPLTFLPIPAQTVTARVGGSCPGDRPALGLGQGVLLGVEGEGGTDPWVLLPAAIPGGW